MYETAVSSLTEGIITKTWFLVFAAAHNDGTSQCGGSIQPPSKCQRVTELSLPSGFPWPARLLSSETVLLSRDVLQMGPSGSVARKTPSFPA